VLVVDDELAVRDVCRQILQALGLRVLTAKDGATALAMLADPSNEIAGVITDLHMPGMDGIELTRRIKQAHPALGVILSSGRVDRADAAELPALGIAAQLDKPFTIESLSNALEALLASDYVAR
jgi:CheY-like chemotaxis protein